jgi:hypothetical protein
MASALGRLIHARLEQSVFSEKSSRDEAPVKGASRVREKI